MMQPTNSTGDRIKLDTLFEDAIAALSILDAEAIEALVESLSGDRVRVELPRSPAEWEKTAAHRWVFGHLLGETARRLTMLRRISAPSARFGAYGGEVAQNAPPLPAASLRQSPN